MVEYLLAGVLLCFVVDVTLSTSLFMFHLISFSPHFIVHESSLPSADTSLLMFHCYFLQSTVHLIHLAYHSPSRSYLPYLVIYHITCSLNHIVSFAFQPNLSPGISGLRVFLKEVLILDRYSLLEAELRWFYYSLSLCVGQEKKTVEGCLGVLLEISTLMFCSMVL